MKALLRKIAGRFGLAVIDYETAVFAAVLIGQLRQGNRAARRDAAADLGYVRFTDVRHMWEDGGITRENL